MIWDDARFIGFDFESSGTLPEHALQPWRLDAGDFWATSMSIIRREGNALVTDGSKLFPSVDDMRAFLIKAIAIALVRHPRVNAYWNNGAVTARTTNHIALAALTASPRP